MNSDSPVLVWFRRDLRLSDHEALTQAAATGRPVIPVFIHDGIVENLGAAPKFRLGLGLDVFSRSLERIGSRLVFRRGPALDVLRGLITETGAGLVVWQRAYDPASMSRDRAVKSALEGVGVDVRVCRGHVLFEPSKVVTRSGEAYSVFTPFWKAVRDLDPGTPLARVNSLRPYEASLASDRIADWKMDLEMRRGRSVVARYAVVGEAAASDRLSNFVSDGIVDYAKYRNLPATGATSRLSVHLAIGEISPRTVWSIFKADLNAGGGVEAFLRELVWREFAYHLLHHSPRMAKENWRSGWDAFPWNEDESRPEVIAWKRGRTGVEFVDAAMRELMVTGYMHNRARMIVAGYLTKHIMTHWRVGLRWFEEHLIDWDPASNAMGWQWSAGSGPDAAPYFRILNPDRQLERFDPDRIYTRRWIAEGQSRPPQTALEYFETIPRSWDLAVDSLYPPPVVSMKDGRDRALKAYKDIRSLSR